MVCIPYPQQISASCAPFLASWRDPPCPCLFVPEFLRLSLPPSHWDGTIEKTMPVHASDFKRHVDVDLGGVTPHFVEEPRRRLRSVDVADVKD